MDQRAIFLAGTPCPRSAPGFSVSSKTAVTRRRPMFAFAFRFAVVLALAVIVLLVTTWERPRIPSNACRKQPHFVLSPRPMWAPPGRGDFSVSNFDPDPIPGNLGETIFGAREVAGGEWGGLFWATSLGKIIGGVTALISFRLQRDGCSSLPCRVVLSFRSEAREASGSETSRVHHGARRHGRSGHRRPGRGHHDRRGREARDE
jgi:hypothetical protein